MEKSAKKSYLYLTSQAFSMFGSSIVDYVIIWYITLKSGSALMLSMSLVVTYLPKITGTYFVEKKVRFEHMKSALIYADLLTAFLSTLLAVLILLGIDEYSVILTVLALRAVGAGVQSPCEKILLAEITPDCDLVKINGFNSVISSICSLVAPALGGIIVVTVSTPAALMIDFVTVLFAVIFLVSINTDNLQGRRTKEILFGQLDGTVKKVLGIHMIFTFLIVPVAFLTPLLVSNTFSGDISKLAYNEVAYSCGAIICGLFVSAISKRLKMVRNVPIAMAISGALIFFLPNAIDTFFVYCIIMSLSSFFISFFQILVISILQNMSVQKNRKLIFSRYETMTNTSLPIGMMLWGFLGDTLSIRKTLICSGMILLIFSVIAIPNLRMVERQVCREKF